jgi:hypothetical protein
MLSVAFFIVVLSVVMLSVVLQNVMGLIEGTQNLRTSIFSLDRTIIHLIINSCQLINSNMLIN